MRGTVKWYNDSKGFGLIDGEDGKDYPVFPSGLGHNVEVRDGDHVEFDAGKTSDGRPLAKNVQKV